MLDRHLCSVWDRDRRVVEKHPCWVSRGTAANWHGFLGATGLPRLLVGGEYRLQLDDGREGRMRIAYRTMNSSGPPQHFFKGPSR
jgi:hypothetical protein